MKRKQILSASECRTFPIDYSEMHQWAIRNDFWVSRVVVAQIMKPLDHISIDARRKRVLRHCLFDSRDPIEFVISLDGHNKLRLYGFEIHGCIDIYSPQVLWSIVIWPNKDATDVCNLYFNLSITSNGAPWKNVVDRGTENVNIPC